MSDKKLCSWCGAELHETVDFQYSDISTIWCDCGWWDALPTREEEEEKRN